MNVIFGYVTECVITRLILYSFHMYQGPSRNKTVCVSVEIVAVNWSSNINFRKSCNVHKREKRVESVAKVLFYR